MDLLQELKDNPFVLAPMAGITDVAFRNFMRSQRCGPMITELVSAKGLIYGSDRTFKLTEIPRGQGSVGVQLFGDSPGDIAEAAKIVEQETGADFVDLNFGCPVPKVVKRGAGAGVLRDLSRLSQILNQVKGAIKIPLTIKIRTGWDQASVNAEEVAKIAFNEGCTWVGIHGRTRCQGYKGRSDWNYINTVSQSAPLPIIGNGDISSASEAVDRLRTTNCQGVMIGRGSLKNPWLFKAALKSYGRLKSGKDASNTDSIHNGLEMLNSLNQLSNFIEEYNSRPMAILKMKKFAAWYSSGFPGASFFRGQVFGHKEWEPLQYSIQEFFSMQLAPPEVNLNSFLLGGHG